MLGALAFLSFAPYRWYALMPLLLAGFVLLGTRAQTWRQAAGLGYCFGLGYFLFGVSWVYVSMHEFGGMTAPLAAFATLVFCAYLALYPALAASVLGIARYSPTRRALVLFPAAWALSEWLRGWVFTGFPWLAAGYSQVPDGPLGQFGPLLGVYGVSWVTASCGAALAGLIVTRQGPRRWAAGVLIGLVALGFGLRWTTWTRPAGTPFGVSLLQGNIAQSLKWDPAHVRTTLDTYLSMTQAATTLLILLPETALPLFDTDVPPEYLRALGDHARSLKGDVLIGIPEYAGRDIFYNSVMSFGSAPTQTYRKHHLVPFGDFVPRWGVLTWIMKSLQIPMSSFSHGEAVQRPLAVAGQQVAVNICYEDVFGEELIRQLPMATFMVNFTNDAWWGKSGAAEQHLQISQMRARETGRFMLRATNTGVTAIIDQHGRVRAQLAQFTQATLSGSAQGYQGATPFVRGGNLPVLLGTVIILIIGFWRHVPRR